MIRTFTESEFLFILASARWTLLLTVMALLLGGLLGFLVALARTSRLAPLRALAAGWIGVIQGVPVLMLLFLSYYGLSLAGFDLPPLIAATVSMALYASGYLGEIWRGCIQAVPWQQWEASAALAFSRAQQYRYVIIPQAVRIAIPPTVGFIVQLVKNTSIVSIIGVVELARAGNLVNNATFSPFKVFGTVAAIYFVICWPISLLARRLEGKLHARRAG
ncbi:amino acid ABC transporter permease [Paracraurococcus ruber]|uniref:Amino acid ABC transporter permease n=1 Tax=Paracraurococcus ruber TaxID=77675 RepID=A0ABS1CTL8_9PROT|nr:amino acid ABC transporter permease [Paracraurococcus ruber]MBK1657825.1 amino acid ABC transporter permease [Paracraurococcus ruber]TDG31396.1 amino acid ABC transporter permease [Paracraurococcus ruber]